MIIFIHCLIDKKKNYSHSIHNVLMNILVNISMPDLETKIVLGLRNRTASTRSACTCASYNSGFPKDVHAQTSLNMLL